MIIGLTLEFLCLTEKANIVTFTAGHSQGQICFRDSNKREQEFQISFCENKALSQTYRIPAQMSFTLNNVK